MPWEGSKPSTAFCPPTKPKTPGWLQGVGTSVTGAVQRAAQSLRARSHTGRAGRGTVRFCRKELRP